jgi:hypothetical protein
MSARGKPPAASSPWKPACVNAMVIEELAVVGVMPATIIGARPTSLVNGV